MLLMVEGSANSIINHDYVVPGVGTLGWLSVSMGAVVSNISVHHARVHVRVTEAK